jgi:protocatechuate 3,4-dioxygenase beta subunit
MRDGMRASPTRRRILQAGFLVSATAVAWPHRGSSAASNEAPLTPACDDGDDPTPSQTAGPFFTPDSPERTSLRERGVTGTSLVLTGLVLTRDCRPIAGALLDFWHADDAGAYDNDGYRLRGHQFADDAGRYQLETIVPGLYPGRTRHFHVRVQAPAGPILTTQLYFPDEPQNQRDRLFRPDLLVTRDGAMARFDFVLEPS